MNKQDITEAYIVEKRRDSRSEISCGKHWNHSIVDAIQAYYRHPYTVLLRSDISTMKITPYLRRSTKPYSHGIETGGQKSRVENTGFMASQTLSSCDYHRSAVCS